MKCQWDDCYISAAGGEFFCLTHKEELGPRWRTCLTPKLVLANGALLRSCDRDGCDNDGRDDHLCPRYSEPGDEMHFGNACNCCEPCTDSCKDD